MATDDLLVRIDATTTGYEAAMLRAQKATGTYEAALMRTQVQLATLEKQMNDELVAKTQARQAAFTKIGTAAGVMGAAAALGVGIAVKAAADFDQQMSKVAAATGESARGMDDLRAAAMKAGADTVYSAGEAAEGIEALAKAGISTTDILSGGLAGALDLAAAGGQEVADAAESMATAMAQFSLEGADAPHVADLLAAAAGKAQGEVSDMSQALNQAGLVAANTGLSIEDTTGALAAFANKGLLGSDAGTSLKTMLQKLTPETAKAASAMEAAGIDAYDAGGNFVGLTEYAGQLKRGLSGMSEEQRNATLKTIYGSDAVRAATVLYDEGAKGIGRWINKVDDQGFAAETAAKKLDNLKGDLEALKGSLETALIGTGEGANGPLRSLVQNLTDLVNIYNDLPKPVKESVLQVGAFMALFGGGVFVASRVISGLTSIRSTIGDLGGAARDADGNVQKMSKSMLGLRAGAGIAGMAVAMADLGDAATDTERGMQDLASGALMGFAVGGPWGAAIGGALGLVKTFAGMHNRASEKVDKLTATLDTQTGALTENSGKWASTMLSDSGILTDLDDLGLSVEDVTRAMLGNEDATARVNKVLAGTKRVTASTSGGFGGLSDAEAKAGITASKLDQIMADSNVTLAASREQWKAEKAAIDAAGDVTQQVGSKFGVIAVKSRKMGGAVEEATADFKRQEVKVEEVEESLEVLIDRYAEYTDAVVASKRDSLGLVQLYKDTAKAVRSAAQGFDENTKAGQKNWSTILDLAEGWNGAERQARETKGAYAEARKTFIETAEALGMNSKRAVELADKYLKMNGPMIRAKETAKETNRVTGIALDETNAKAVALGKTDPTVKVSADTASAAANLKNFATTTAATLDRIPDEVVGITLSAEARKMGEALPGLATGGALSPSIYGGTPGKDSISARLMPDEHVVTTAEVKGAGGGSIEAGHRMIRGLRQMALRGELQNMGVRPFALGGEVKITPRTSASGVAAAASSVSGMFDTIADSIGAALSTKITAQIHKATREAAAAARAAAASSVGGSYKGPAGAWVLPLPRGSYSVGGGIGSYPGHTGLDLPAGYGTSVYSASAGRVSQAQDLTTSYGRHVYVDHGGGAQTRYAHMASRAVGVGATVRPGSRIGSVDSTGNSSGNHLHFETRSNGAVQSPPSFMAARGVRFDQGGSLLPGLTLAYNGTGRSETVRTHQQEVSQRGSGAELARLAQAVDRLASRGPTRVVLDHGGGRTLTGWMDDRIDGSANLASTVGRQR